MVHRLVSAYTPLHAGYLQKLTSHFTWHRRFFVLRPHALVSYANHKQKKLLRSIPLEDITAIEAVQKNNHAFCVGLVTKDRKYYLDAQNQKDQLEWVAVLREQWRRSRDRSVQSTSAVSSDWVDILHDNIIEEEDIHATSPSATELRAYLLKKSRKRKQWKKRWFVFHDQKLAYYHHETDSIPRMIVPVLNISSIEVAPDPAGENRTKRRWKWMLVVKERQGEGEEERQVFIAAKSRWERQQWVDALLEGMQRAKEKADGASLK